MRGGGVHADLPPLPEPAGEERAPARRAGRRAVALGLLLVAGGAFGAVVGRLARGAPSPDGRAALVMLPLALAAALLAIALHELGHVLAGLSRGFRFQLLAVGPLWIGREGDRIRPRLNRVPATWGGVAACVPLAHGDPRVGMAVMAAGGPAASLVVAAAAGLGHAALAPGPARTFLGALALVSAGLGLVTALLPSAGGGFRSDGRRVRDLLRGDAAAEREAALVAVQGLSLAGVRPREWPPALVARAAETGGGGPFEAAAALLAALHALDLGDAGASNRQLARIPPLWPGLPPLIQPHLAAEAAIHEALERGDAGRAARWLARAEATARGALVDAHQLHTARAAVALARGDRDLARREAEAALGALPRARFPASALDRERPAAIAARTVP